MTDPISTVVLGYGLGGRIFHAPLVAAEPGLRLDAIVTSDPGRQAQARADHPGVAVYATAGEAWSGGHGLAVITTANVTHVPYAQAALAAGMNVVVDKPVAATSDDAEALINAAEAAGVVAAAFQNRRWDSDFLTVRAAIDSGAIGTPHRWESRIERMRVIPKGGWRESTAPEDMGGMLYDLGAHVIDQSLALLGPVELVEAIVRSVRVPGATDDDVVVVLTHATGAVSVLVASVIAAFPGPRMTVFGTRGGIRVDASDSQEEALIAGARPGNGAWGVEPAGTEATLRVFDDASVVTQSRVPLEHGAWPAYYANIAAAIRGDAPVAVPLSDAVADLRVMDAARESARRGTAVRLDPPAGHAASTG